MRILKLLFGKSFFKKTNKKKTKKKLSVLQKEKVHIFLGLEEIL